MTTTPKQKNYHPQMGGTALADWIRGVPMSRPTFYNLDDESKPDFVKIGTRIVVIEPPADWLARMAKRGGATTKRKEQASA